MKIDLEMLEAMVASGATGSMVLAVVRLQCERHEAMRASKRPAEKDGKRRKATERRRKPEESERQAATLSDTPRARLFREAKPALLTMKIADSRAGALIVGWLKLTNDDDQLVLATILRAQSMAVVDAPGWILATLKGRINGNGTGSNGANQSGSAAIIAGTAAAVERRARERGAGGHGRDAPGSGGPAGGDEPEFFGAQHD